MSITAPRLEAKLAALNKIPSETLQVIHKAFWQYLRRAL